MEDPNIQRNFKMKDMRVTSYSPLISPDRLRREIWQSEASKRTVHQGRAEIVKIIHSTSPAERLFVAIGPCSIHDPVAAREYAARLLVLRQKHQNELEIAMRCYTEKPRTRGGWKGLVNDPDMDNTFQINKGLRVARQLFADITAMGLPLVSELLDTVSPQFLADVLSVGVVGARTTECQLHRELASGCSFPVGFKNATDGSVTVAIDAIEAANRPHHFLAITKSGTAAVVGTSGNGDCFVILRGGKYGPNYDKESVKAVKEDIVRAGRRARIMVDCSHGNSQKSFKNQAKVTACLGEQIAAGETAIMGVMIESNINEGSQAIPANGLQDLKYGVSVTDSCIGWHETENIIESLAQSVKLRRAVLECGHAKDITLQSQQIINADKSAYLNQPHGQLSNGHRSHSNSQVTSGHQLDVDNTISNGHQLNQNGTVTNGHQLDVDDLIFNGHQSGLDGPMTNGHELGLDCRIDGPASSGHRSDLKGSVSNSHELGLDGRVSGPASNGYLSVCNNEDRDDGTKLLPDNLYQLLMNTAKTSGSGITIYTPGHALHSSTRITYHDLFRQAHVDADLIRQIDGSKPNSTVLIHFNDHSQNIRWFWATVVAGCLPAISLPFVNDPDQRRKHLVHMNNLLQVPIILTSEKLVPEFLGLEQLNIQPVETLEARDGFEDSFIEVANLKRRDDPAALMFTSGSTGNTKAVCLRHGQLLVALAGKSRYHETTGNDVFLNWIGMDHVASLTEIHLHAMSLGSEQVHANATDLVTKPMSFLALINKHRVTYTFAPNFFLAFLRRTLDDIDHLLPDSKDLDLSCLKALISGGEANVVETCAALTKQLQRYHVAGEPIRPGFGMTETCAGSIYGKACPSYDLGKNSEFASLGSCIPGIEMRVVKDDGIEAATNDIGNLQVFGPVVFAEYYNDRQTTIEAFTSDGWFITGDRAMIDDQGYLNLTGRVKDNIIINGVKHSPHELEAALDEAAIPGITASYNAVFPHRPRGSETESLCVVYLPTYIPEDAKARTETADAIANVSGLVCGVRPYEIIPLDKSQLPKTSLGKLSRAKIRTAFETGMYHDAQKLNKDAIKSYRIAHLEKPSTSTERLILSVICERFELASDEIGVHNSLFHFGVTSIDLIALKSHIQEKLALEKEIPLITILSNPTVRGMANALDNLSSVQPYNPVITLRRHEGKAPLWLVHPGVGEVLVFLNLTQYITDRSVYALRARGFNEGEDFFKSIPEVVSTYHQHIKRVQPEGPYAIAGYSFGAMLAFEISKLLESQGDKVGFLGSFNLPPHIKTRMKELDWTEVVLNLSYFLDLITEEYAHEISVEMHELSHDKVLDYMLQIAPPGRLKELSLDKKKLATWVSLAHAMQYAAREYDPSGSVAGIDVFFAIPLAAVAKNKDDWVANHLSKWKDFSRSVPRFHEVAGAHYTMMGPKHVLSFQKILKSVLNDRGL